MSARRRRPAGAVLVLAALVALGVAAGCGSASEAPEQPFGTPPAPAPGVHAWAAGEPGVVLATADGGATWTRQRFFLPQRGVDVAFADTSTGWLATDAGTVLRTTDGGAGWTVVEQTTDVTVKAIAAAGAGSAWVVGSAPGAAGEPAASVVLHTADGGETWRRSRFGAAQLADVAFADERRGVLVALDRIWSTRDGGRTWRLRRTLPMTVLTSVAAGDARRLWVAGWDTETGGPLVLATRDAGATWRRLSMDLPPAEPGALQARQIACAGDGHLWVTCARGVIATADGGRTWELQRVPAGQPLGVAAADAAHVLATTESRPLLATADGGATWQAAGSRGFPRQPMVAIAAVLAEPAE